MSDLPTINKHKTTRFLYPEEIQKMGFGFRSRFTMVLKRGIFGIKHNLAQLREELDDQISTRLDRIEMMLEGQAQRYNVQPLTYPEKQVFVVLYTEETPLTHIEIAQRTEYTEALVQQYVTNLIEKGIPIIKSYFNSKPFMKLNQQFKEAQAKNNILNLSLQSFVDA
jgi:DNA-binding MarR family transcriptional regulator